MGRKKLTKELRKIRRDKIEQTIEYEQMINKHKEFEEKKKQLRRSRQRSYYIKKGGKGGRPIK